MTKKILKYIAFSYIIGSTLLVTTAIVLVATDKAKIINEFKK